MPNPSPALSSKEMSQLYQLWTQKYGWRLYAFVWLLPLQIGIYFLSGKAGLYFYDLYKIANDSPGDSPPWYFIRQSYVSGICQTVGMLISTLILCPFLLLDRPSWARFQWASMALWMTWLWQGGHVWELLVIWFKTSHIMTPEQAKTSWTTFDDFLFDPWISCGRIAVLVVVGTLAAYLTHLSNRMFLQEMRTENPALLSK